MSGALAQTLADWETRTRAALDWLVVSWERCGRTGSAAHYSPLLGWSGPYPETTGYIIPTLLRGADQFHEPRYADAAISMARWLLTLQGDDGWFPGGVWHPRTPSPPSIFNTGQILFGLLAAGERTGDDVFQTAAARAAQWLIREQDSDGRWRRHAYRADYSPSYYAHVCWPLAEYGAVTGDQPARQAVVQGLTAVAADRQPNGAYSGWGFTPRGRAFTHTIAYTLQGIIESARILDEWEQFAAPAVESAYKLLRKFELQRQLAGDYDADWKGTFWYACLTGHCQLASTWLRIYERTSDPRYLNGATKALEFVIRHQLWKPARPEMHGAIAGSAPWYGPYLRLRYPNWAAKFFADAVTDACAALRQLEIRSALPLISARAA